MQAPTDNLYKFLAISGLVAFLYFQYELQRRTDDISLRIYAAQEQSAVLKAEAENTESVIARISARIEYLREIKDVEKTLEYMDAIARYQDEFLKRNVDLARAEVAIAIIQDLNRRMSDYYEKARYMSSAASGLFGLGLWLWYRKTQRYLNEKEIPTKPLPIKLKQKLPSRRR